MTKIHALKMADRDDTSARGHLLPWCSSIADAAEKMGVAESTIRRAIAGKTGFVAIVRLGCQQPACCIDRP